MSKIFFSLKNKPTFELQIKNHIPTDDILQVPT